MHQQAEAREKDKDIAIGSYVLSVYCTDYNSIHTHMFRMKPMHPGTHEEIVPALVMPSEVTIDRPNWGFSRPLVSSPPTVFHLKHY